MEWAYLELGSVRVIGADPRGVLVEYKPTFRLEMPSNVIRLVPTEATFVAEHTAEPARRTHRQRTVPTPFERTSLGRKDRLAWPNGATTIDQYAHIAVWGDRFAIVLDDRGFRVIDAEADRVVRLMLPPDTLRWELAEPIASGGHVWIGAGQGAVGIPTTMLAELAAGEVDVALVRHHPMRKRDAKLACVFLWFLANGKAMVEIGDGTGGAKEPKLEIAMPSLGLAKYEPVTLVDELYPWHYAAVEVPGRERVALASPSAPIRLTAKVTVARAKDPTGVAKAPAAQRHRSNTEIERLVAAIAANPDDDAQRAVLTDLLLELGDPSAEAIAKLRAGTKLSAAKLKEALGPLGLYLIKVEHAGGFPVEATVTRDAPNEDDHAAELDAACADFRLALIHTLHSQRGRRASPAIYARLVGAPNASALRRVDVSDRSAIDALIAAERDQLEYLEHVDFADARAVEQLATPTFDRVTTVHTVVGLAHLQPLVNRLIKDKSRFFKRARRRLVLEETRARKAELLTMLAPVWPRLPLTALAIGGVSIERGGAITGDDVELVEVARAAFAVSG